MAEERLNINEVIASVVAGYGFGPKEYSNIRFFANKYGKEITGGDVKRFFKTHDVVTNKKIVSDDMVEMTYKVIRRM